MSTNKVGVESIQTAVIVGVNTGDYEAFEKVMDELERLVEALDLEVCGQLSQDLPSPNPATYLGSGKLLELKEHVEFLEADYVVFADTLSPVQLKNITKEIEVTVYDRTGLILEIFKRRAKTREARLQVESANLAYMLPRLVGMRTSLGRQAGASGSMSNRGQGEKQIELDRRHIEKRISELRRTLDDISKDRDIQRKARNKSNIPRVSLVGYTNAGKSTLMNRFLSGMDSQEDKKVFEKDMLFATLDTSVRRISTGDRKDFLLSDTVGFVSNLPHGLIKAFRSTLEEATTADLLLVIADCSDEGCKDQIEVTLNTLKELDAQDIPRLIVMNKCDLVGEKAGRYDEYNETIYISAKSGDGIDKLLEIIKSKVYGGNEILELLILYSDGGKLNLINENARVISQDYQADGVKVVCDVPKWLVGKIVSSA